MKYLPSLFRSFALLSLALAMVLVAPIAVAQSPQARPSSNILFADIVPSLSGEIEQQYAGKIFDIFQRLNDRSAYEGTGIGLALCKKIVGNHGGHIYAEGQVGVGATFHIILPIISL